MKDEIVGYWEGHPETFAEYKDKALPGLLSAAQRRAWPRTPDLLTGLFQRAESNLAAASDFKFTLLSTFLHIAS